MPEEAAGGEMEEVVEEGVAGKERVVVVVALDTSLLRMVPYNACKQLRHSNLPNK